MCPQRYLDADPERLPAADHYRLKRVHGGRVLPRRCASAMQAATLGALLPYATYVLPLTADGKVVQAPAGPASN
ncbi:MAG TPA: hypothetical protein VK501_12935 [Baekduia sp.]|uniref:hypothetical protein n=1 Tax=Baekduia sp. TaxID=2600305 RepID=UPI002C7AB66D|nr:hypothetical protein [Baekduia sp.]HMJ34811.1 hypothetical protein [Baekduia sp.]